MIMVMRFQGAGMWLAVGWLPADLVGRSDRLDYRPRGVHRPEPGRQPISRCVVMRLQRP
jgi:hypothetical protein